MRHSSTTPWNTDFFEAMLTIFPSSIRPVYIPFRKIKGSTEFFIKRALFISITTPTSAMYRSVEESILLRKTIYRQFNISEITPVPEKLNVLYIAREGTNRQILNEEALLEKLHSIDESAIITKRYFARLTFEQQVKLMSTVDFTFGIHGAAFINILFMRPKSALLEFFAPTFHAGYYESISLTSYMFYDSVRDNFVEYIVDNKTMKKRKHVKDPRNANLNINLKSAAVKYTQLLQHVKEEKYKSVPVVL